MSTEGVPVPMAGLEVTRKVAAARLWAANKFPYLASALFASPVLLRDGIGTIGADEHWRLYADPALVESWSVEQLGASLVHHSGHLLREHGARAKAHGVSTEDTHAWVDAADAEINDDLTTVIRLADDAVLPVHLGAPDGRLAEEYFLPASERECTGHDCGSACHGQPRAWEEGGGEEPDGSQTAPGLGEASADLLRRQVAGDIRQHSRQAGTVPSSLLRWAEQLLDPKVDWRKVLASELRRGLSEVAGRVDYSYRRPSRRAAAVADVILPSLRRPVPDVAVVCDTSGSMDESTLGRVLGEVDGILRAVGVGSTSVQVLAVDTAVHSARKVTSARQVELVGGGGTDMGAGLHAATELRPRPGVVVVLTDGYTPWPARAPRGITVVVGLLGESAPAGPVWARCVRIED